MQVTPTAAAIAAMSAGDGCTANADCTQPPKPEHAVVHEVPKGASIQCARLTFHVVAAGDIEGVTLGLMEEEAVLLGLLVSEADEDDVCVESSTSARWAKAGVEGTAPGTGGPSAMAGGGTAGRLPATTTGAAASAAEAQSEKNKRRISEGEEEHC